MLHSRGCARVSVGALNELNGLNTEKRKKDNQKDAKGGKVAGNGGGVMNWEIGIDIYTLITYKIDKQ